MVRVVKTEVRDLETGELLHSREMYGTNNGTGWVVNYRSASYELALKCSSACTFKVFHLLVSMQENYEDKGVICSRKWLQNTLGISRKSVYNSLSWLIQNHFLITANRAGCTEFFFNPSKVTIGRDKERRMRRWRELCREFNEAQSYREYGFDSPVFGVDNDELYDTETGEIISSAGFTKNA